MVDLIHDENPSDRQRFALWKSLKEDDSLKMAERMICSIQNVTVNDVIGALIDRFGLIKD